MNKKPYKKKYHQIDNFFSNPESLIANYWAGFIAADGYITKCSRRLEIGLAIKDIKHLQQFKKDINYTGLISKYNYKNEKAVISISCKKYIKDLFEIYNITNKKSLTLMPPNITGTDNKLAFICGYLDGDGCIRIENKKHLCLSFRGTIPILNWIGETLKEIDSINIIKYKPSNNIKTKHQSLKFKGFTAKIILSFLKKTFINLPLMKRKWDKININDIKNPREYNSRPFKCLENNKIYSSASQFIKELKLPNRSSVTAGIYKKQKYKQFKFELL